MRRVMARYRDRSVRSVNPVVHLELHTGDERDASAFYSTLMGWQPERVRAGCGSYLALDLGAGVGGGVVECGTDRALWLPYVEVRDLGATHERAIRLGASVLLEPRDGPAGRRSVLSSAAGGEIALWQPKDRQ